MKVVVFVLGAALLSGASMAQAETVETRRVATRDLDLSTPKGVERLYSRIQSVAEDVCQSSEGPLTTAEAERVCQVKAVDEAVSRFNSPLLNRLHAAHAPAQAQAEMRLAEQSAKTTLRGK
ncbi:UrcA family protein [Asticcacaulis excentricus]|uniref:UrcA family protein n=1 Tax=Asticcacaulis excentricus (strain ATCC 15261 / DSM 4724 / KCTC 12464 / NCIMB 9791 / VKM B-1370 / CB 48) TaxID=573065 RepID=E8RTJ8_ASTEC|nr:UrcA family protein [Asticcacaulis excentricus]ADU14819.1 hypothetical protein Astex_3184 [Asticcacaulis excentricus CB 48]